MKITNIQAFDNTQLFLQKNKQNKNYNQQNTHSEITSKDFYSYQDFNISFTGRTPEDFYAQDFNSENMPQTMKNYLYYDYEQRQHIPPEQIMQEVFKHLNKAKNLDEVKLYYPKEPLFQNLHELKKNPRTGILSEIKLAKEMSDTPLLKDGSDDFGLYLLKKIYIEGKTIKEISKDFYEKDINEEYKGIIAQPIDYSTTSAYGIRYPKNDFWHSFISTRDEYKKFFITLPKNMVDPNRTSVKGHSEGKSAPKTAEPKEVKPQPRKYKIKDHRKKDVKNDIKNSDGSEEEIKKIIRKRFTKDDPEASFIIKYMSPIMTVAAEKIHLSEEEKYFAETEKDNGITVNGKTMFERFWKANPDLREHYSAAIIDTIELFEEVYGGGGLIPINSNYETIGRNTQNQKTIDYVLPEFIDLLNYSNEIMPKREAKYARHDKEQALWEEHFRQRYGEVIEEQENVADVSEKLDQTTTVDKALNESALKNGAKVYNFILENGTKVSIASNVQEMLKSRIALEYSNMPQSFINRYTNFILNHPKVNEDFLLAFACHSNDMKNWGNFVYDDNYMDEELQALNNKIIKEIKSQLVSEEEVFDTMKKIFKEFEEQNPKFMKLVKQAIMEYSTQLETPDEDYIKMLITKRYVGKIKENIISENLSKAEKQAEYQKVYRQTLDGIKSMKSHNIVYLDTSSLEAGLAFLSIGKNVTNQSKKMDEIMQKYKKPLSSSEQNKITHAFMNILLNMKPEDTESFKDRDLAALFLSMRECLKKHPNYRKDFAEIINKLVITPDNTTMKYLLDKNADKNLAAAKVEYEFSSFVQEHIDIFKLFASLDKEIMEEYIKYANPILYEMLLGFRQKTVLKKLLKD